MKLSTPKLKISLLFLKRKVIIFQEETYKAQKTKISYAFLFFKYNFIHLIFFIRISFVEFFSLESLESL